MMLIARVLVLALSSSARVAIRPSHSRVSSMTMMSSPGKLTAVDLCSEDVDRAVKFCQSCFGMDAIADEAAGGQARLQFPGDSTYLHITDGSKRPEHGLCEIVINCQDLQQVLTCAEVRGGSVVFGPETRTAGPSKIPDEAIGTVHETLEACIRDCDGNVFRLVQHADRAPTVARVVRQVSDLDQGKAFYSGALGLDVLRWRSNLQSKPMETSISMQVGSPSTVGTAEAVEAAPADAPAEAVVELIYRYNTDSVTRGEGMAGRITIAVPDVSVAVQEVRLAGVGSVSNEEATTADLLDPDGHPVRLTQLQAP